MATPTPSQLAIATLYTAAFNRAPDAAGFDFWLQAYQRGASLSGLATTFLGTPEGQATYPAGLSSQAFVAAFYTSVFGRSADESGLKFWTEALDALGGAGSATAKAALMVNIIGVASTPITTKPDGVSDAAYAQTVADRARFINKTEFGVYFAAELRSNDLSLAKQMLALVTADPASVSAARTLAEQGGVTPPVTPPVVVPALTSADDVSTITSKLAAYSGTDATANTSGMDATQLKAVAAGASKFKADGLSGALALTSSVTSTEAAALLAKYAGTTASANATGMDAAYLAVLAGASTKFAAGSIATPTLALVDGLLDDPTTEVLLAKSTGAQIDAAGATAAELLSIVNHIGAVAAGGITGTFALVGNLSAAQLTVLLGKLATGAHVTADVSAMDASQLAVLAAKPLALDAGALTGTLNLSASLTSTAVGVLLNRYAGTTATLVATSAGSDVLNAAAASLSKISSISGDLAILSDVIPAYGLILLGKYVGSSATIDASLFNSTQLQSLTGSLSKLTTVTQPKLVLADAWLSATVIDSLLAKAANAGVTVTGASDAQLTSLLGQLSHVAADGIVGTLALISTTAAATSLDALLQKTAVAATVNVNAASMDADQVVLLFTHAAKIDSLSNLSVVSSIWARLPADFGSLFTKGLGIQADLSTASVAQLKLVTQFSGQYATAGLTGTFALDQGFSATQLGVLLGNRVNASADVTVSAAGMDVDQVVALFANAANVDHLTNLSAPSGTMAQIGSNFGLLFTKGAGGTMAVDLTGATASQLQVIGQFSNSYKADGLTGSYTIDKDVSSFSFASLLGDRVADAANVTIQATGMNDAQLAAAALGIGKVDTILGLSLTTANTASLSDSQAASLLSKATSADVTGMTSLAFTNALSLVADGTLKGSLSLGSSALQAATAATLDTKLATGATLNITGTDSNDVINLTGLSKGSYIAAGKGADTITLGSGADTVFFRDIGDTRSTSFSTTDATSDNISKIHGLQAGDLLKFSTAPGAFVNNVSFNAGATTQVISGVLTLNANTIADLYAGVNTNFSGFTQGSNANRLEVLQLTLGNQGAFANKVFLIFNDGNVQVDQFDAIVEITAGVTISPSLFAFGV